MPESLEPNLEEIAEDMVHLLERLRSMEQAQQELADRIENVGEQVSAQMTATRRTLNALRRDLLEENKAQASRHAFDAIVPVLDSMRALLNGLDADEDTKTIAQLGAVTSALSNLLQGLGYDVFDAALGEPFDPARMECLGFAEGEPQTVLEAVRPGYRAGDTVVRPAGVRIAEPSLEEDVSDTEDDSSNTGEGIES
jgi:molecular chaperone GrpE (heat shock protein)